MGSLKRKLAHAFAVDPPGVAEPTPEQQPAVDWVCRQVAMRHLTTPGLIALEMMRPLNWIGAQGLHVLAPGVWAIASQQSYEGYKRFAEYLERRGAMEYLARRVEHFEEEFERKAREARASRASRSPSPGGTPEERYDEDRP